MDEGKHLREVLARAVITAPLLEMMAGRDDLGVRAVDPDRSEESVEDSAEPPTPDALIPVVVDLNLGYAGGVTAAADRLRALIAASPAGPGAPAEAEGVVESRTPPGTQYLVARLTAATLTDVARRDRVEARGRSGQRAIFRVWPDFPVQAHTNRSVCTTKVDAARLTFNAWGEGVVWAVIDSGIEGEHAHFRTYDNLALDLPLRHKDFTGTGDPLKDEFGHGTHVAGILAGHAKSTRALPLHASTAFLDEAGNVQHSSTRLSEMSGMAPRCKVVSYKVLGADGTGETSAILAALREIDEVNEHGRMLKIHGVNLSVGYSFDPEWFACGQSPLCVEVNRLVASGVVVVVSAGNTGYGSVITAHGATAPAAGVPQTINDPGNAERAITVGSTHRDSPHLYGASYFSSKGPTGDGRHKPDLVAPGERILAPAAGKLLDDGGSSNPLGRYAEDTGTSMAAPHVSGAVAALLSVRREYVGQPDAVKDVVVSTALDLGRDRSLQGSGLLDLLKALQSM